MDHFDKEKIATLSHLCRIKMTDEEMEHFREHINKILSYVVQLQSVDVSHLTPYSHIEEQGIDTLREDCVETTLSRKEFLENAPKHIGGMVAVPTIIKQ